MTPALTPAKIPENHLQGVPCRTLERGDFFSGFLISDHLPQQKVEIPIT